MRRLYPSVHLLRAFVMTARFTSISRAAETLHLTQSAVSKQIQELESTVGVLLFERVRKRLSLTPAGARYEAAIRPLLAQLEAADPRLDHQWRWRWSAAQGYTFARPDLDCSILFGDGNWPGAVAEYVTGRDVMLIAPPALKSKPLLKKPQDDGYTDSSGYYLCSPEGKSHLAPLISFRDWLVAQTK